MNIQKLIVWFEKEAYLFIYVDISVFDNQFSLFWQFCIKKSKLIYEIWELGEILNKLFIHAQIHENDQISPLFVWTGAVLSFPPPQATFFKIQLLCLKRHQRKRMKFSALPWVMKGFLIFSADDSERVFARYVGFRLFLIDLGQSQKWHKYHEGSGPHKLSSKLCCLFLSEYEAQVFLRMSFAVFVGDEAPAEAATGLKPMTLTAESVGCFFFSPPGRFTTLCNYKPESFFCVADLQPKRNPTCISALIFWFSG